jgi:hypothetical protein
MTCSKIYIYIYRERERERHVSNDSYVVLIDWSYQLSQMKILMTIKTIKSITCQITVTWQLSLNC